MSRKNLLRNRIDASKAEDSADDQSTPGPIRPFANRAPRSSSPIPGLIGDAFEESHARYERAKEIERRLAEGHAVVDLDVTEIDPSFVQDRMEGDIDGLVASIREQGQQVPILVRHHPDGNGRYQVAFGHRRVRALKELGLQAKAIVRDLTDEQLVIAQGQENNEREDLTFIEKARFAARLSNRFSRDVIGSALSLDKTNLSKMLALVGSLPAGLVDAIGAAPGIGRPSWQKMATFLDQASDPDGVVTYATSKEVQQMSSPDRFKAILMMNSKHPARSLAQVMSSPAGDRLAQVTQNKIKLDISIDKRATPEFAAFILDQVPGLFAEYLAKQKLKTGE